MTGSSPLRIAVVTRAVMPLHGVGGLERSVHDLVTHLAARGVEVTLIAPPATIPGVGAGAFSHAETQRREEDTTRTAGKRIDGLVTLREVPYLTFPFANRRGTTILDRSTAYPLFGMRAGLVAVDLDRANAIDIVHGFGASILGYALQRGKAAGVRARSPLVLNPQGLEEFGATADRLTLAKRVGYAPLRAAVRACARAADAIIATDKALEPVVERHLHPRQGQLRTIPNGIDVAAVDGLAGAAEGLAARTRAGIASSDLVLVSAGRLEYNKGFDVLVSALARVFGSGSSRAADRWHWVIAGDGPFRSTLERQIAVSGLGTHVRLLGRVPDRELHAWYEAATLFVHPTRYEGSSLVTLEAMAHRRAIVASRAGGLPDKVQPGLNGWLVAPGDPDALARALEDALSNPPRLAAMGDESRRIVETKFAWTTLAGDHIALYRELLKRR